MKDFTTEQLADRWYDRREIANLAGKLVTSILLKKEETVFEAFWSAREDVCLSFNDGSYIGAEDVRNYFAVQAENAGKISKFLQDLFPEELGEKSDGELYGVGQMRGLPITTPVIEIASDGQTAKGLWHIQGADSGVTAYGPLSEWTLGFLAIDFILENGDWKIWHVLHAEDVVIPMGESWVSPKEHAADPDYAQIAALKKAPYTVEKENYVPYSPVRSFTGPPRVPQPYDTFADTFSYGA